MAALPSPTQVAGSNNTMYESYYNYLDPNGAGTIGAMEAARFLKTSGLSDVVLSRIWDLSDPSGRGYLDKTALFVALNLVSMAQAGRDLNLANVCTDMKPPKLEGIQLPKPKKPPLPSNTPLITSLPPNAVDWSVKPAERKKYDDLFDSLQPINGLIPGNKVKGVLMESKLPLETLGKIWDLADQDKDGKLDRVEFIAAMHLVYKALEKYTIPNTLPPELMPSATKKLISMNANSPLIGGLDSMKPKSEPPPLIPSQPMKPASLPPRPVQPVQPTHNWVVSADEKAKSDALFVKSDVDKDGFVSGLEIKDVFLQSGVPQQVLAHIWALCDINQSGKLNNEQFALAMWFVARCLKGVNPPPTLTSDMVPPTFRTNKPNEAPVDNNNTCYSNPELEMISKDIQELAKEKYALESDIIQKEADIKIKSGEIKSLQSELDTLAATLKQLENQKGEALKRLGDLKAQRASVDTELEAIQSELEAQVEKVEKLRSQAAEQADVIFSQEAELTTKKEQLESLKQEEQRLEQMKVTNTRKLDKLSGNLQSTQLNISQAKAMITQLEEQTRQMNDAIGLYDTAIASGDATIVTDASLRIAPDFREAEYKKLGMVNGDIEENGFDNKNDPFSKQNGHTDITNSFQSDPFASDPFKNNNDALGSSDPFGSSNFSTNDKDAFSADPFNNFNSSSNADPFSAFGDTKHNSITPEPGKDPFGCDPFAVLHAPTRDGSSPAAPAAPGPGRPTSPSPALPPKKAKPPRPAPPRPQPPAFSKPSAQDHFGRDDPFASSAAGGFADFADFDSKCLHRSYLPLQENRMPTFLSRSYPDLITFSDVPNNTTTAASNSSISSKPAKGLDFTDDPFRDYRYEDPFNIAFDDEEPTSATTAAAAATTTTTSTTTADNIQFSFKTDFDAFSGRQSVPLPDTKTRHESSSGRSSVPATIANKNKLNEDEQLAWAAKESLELEEQRKQRQLQEQADLEFAIALSKADHNNK